MGAHLRSSPIASLIVSFFKGSLDCFSNLGRSRTDKVEYNESDAKDSQWY